MKNIRTYGNPPYKVAVVHGGPGGPGQVAPICRELSSICGILEPLQTKNLIEKQVTELESSLKELWDKPITLIGHSWGAMLGIIYAARYPDTIKKLILISCGPLEANYTSDHVMHNRLKRMSDKDKAVFNADLKNLEIAKGKNKNLIFTRLCELAIRIDSYDPAPNENELIEAQYDIFKSVWSEAEAFRRKGGFEEAARKIACPVTVIHGNYDPHPVEGLKTILSAALQNLKFIQLDQCGHYPWIEKSAKERFYSILKEELI